MTDREARLRPLYQQTEAGDRSDAALAASVHLEAALANTLAGVAAQ